MAALPELEAALVKADAAGNTTDAAAFAAEIRRQRAVAPVAPPVSTAPAPAAPAAPVVPAAWDGAADTPEGMRKYIETNWPRDAGFFPDLKKLKPVAQNILQGGTEMTLQAQGATVGQRLGAEAPGILKAPAIMAGGAAGGAAGNYAAQQLRIASGQQDKVHWGELLSAAGTSAIPGMSLEAAGTTALLKEGAKQGVGGLAGKTVQTVVDEGRRPTLNEALLATAVPAGFGALAGHIQSNDTGIRTAVADALDRTPTRSKTFAAAKEAGYTVPPSVVDRENPGFVNTQVESLGGKAAISQQASLDNQKVTNQIAKREVQLPANKDITVEALQAKREALNAPYDEVQRIADEAQAKVDIINRATTSSNAHEEAILKSDPTTVNTLAPLLAQSGADLKALADARLAADIHFKAYRSSGGNLDELAKGKAAVELADTLDGKLETAMLAAGRPELAGQLRAARTLKAKTYAIEEALNLGDSNVALASLGRQLDSKVPLTDGLKMMAQFERAFGKYTTEGSKVPTPGTSALNTILAGAVGAGTYGASGGNLALSTLVGAVAPPLARAAARKVALAGPYQAIFTSIPKPPVNAVPDLLSTAVRTTGQAGATQIGPTAPTLKHIAALREHPELHAEFDAKFGPGAAAKALTAP